MFVNTVEKRRAANRIRLCQHADMHIGYLKSKTEEKLEKIQFDITSKMSRDTELKELQLREAEISRQLDLERKLEEQRIRDEEEERRWKPKTESDTFAYKLIQEWASDFEKENERFFHASFVLTWFIHRKFGICFTGGIERWGKDRGKLKPFGGRRENTETRVETASRELREETIGLVNVSPAELSKLPHVFIMKTNPCYIHNVEVNHHEFRDRLKNEKNPNSLEMKAVVHIPFKQFYNLRFTGQIPNKGVRVEDISGRTTDISAIFLHALRGFGFI